MKQRKTKGKPSKFGDINGYPATPEFMPDNSLDNHIRRRRAEMGERRWAELNREWEA